MPGGGSSASPAAARPLAAGSAARARKGSRSPRASVVPLQTQGPSSPGPSSAPLPAPASRDTRAQRGPQTQPGRSSARGQSQECTRDSGVAAGGPGPAHRAPPLLDQLHPDRGWGRTTRRPPISGPSGPALSRRPGRGVRPPGDQSPNPTKPNGQLGQRDPGVLPQPATHPIRLRLLCHT